jgi:cellulose biosynthesis protein BcsQ
MIDSLSIISGKGGSGKTSLAILLSQLLANCRHKVLLVDCDMSTHGATYFFEDMFIKKENYFAVSNVLYGNTNIIIDYFEVLKISSNIGFIPSRLDFSSKKNSSEQINELKLKIFIEEMEKQGYDIIIFDCQAGYSVETEMVTKLSRANLAVIEADAISASALRVLYTQLSNQLDKGKTYQVFNKITKEEQEIYSKLTHGTFFTNLNPLLFDWNIRKAFVTNELPDVDSSNPVLTTAVYELAIVLFPQYRNDFHKFIITIKENVFSSLFEKQEIIKINNRFDILKKLANFLSPLFLSIIALILTTLLLYNSFNDFFYSFINNERIAIIFVIIVIVLIISFFLVFIKKEKDNNYHNQMLELKKESNQLLEDIMRIKSKINQ